MNGPDSVQVSCGQSQLQRVQRKLAVSCPEDSDHNTSSPPIRSLVWEKVNGESSSWFQDSGHSKEDEENSKDPTCPGCRHSLQELPYKEGVSDWRHHRGCGLGGFASSETENQEGKKNHLGWSRRIYWDSSLSGTHFQVFNAVLKIHCSKQ